MTTNALLSFAVALLLVGPISALAKAVNCHEAFDTTLRPLGDSEASHHIINMSDGDSGGPDVTNLGDAFKAQLRRDMEDGLKRPFFNTSVVIQQVSTGGGLLVEVAVSQEKHPNHKDIPIRRWNPREVNSILKQIHYNNTKGAFRLRGLKVEYVSSAEIRAVAGSCGKTCSTMYLMVALMFVAMGVLTCLTIIIRRRTRASAAKRIKAGRNDLEKEMTENK
uniref:Uncharacterized protein TCIL3000_7_3420 n=1 Tax=Trypanosoma congolense (strain IL3000) TaxID=1068625 RepID=G0UQ67_TRYCI|nr:unnamed protein product [Trypanosoma congolense IL3000]